MAFHGAAVVFAQSVVSIGVNTCRDRIGSRKGTAFPEICNQLMSRERRGLRLVQIFIVVTEIYFETDR